MADAYYNGGSAVNAKAFDGPFKVLNGTGLEISLGNSGAPTLTVPEQAIALIESGLRDTLLIDAHRRVTLAQSVDGGLAVRGGPGLSSCQGIRT
jgi:hypothetical protein